MEAPMIPVRVKELCKEIGLDSKDACWELPQRRGTFVMKHYALEQIGNHLRIKFSEPTIIESDAEKKICVVLVSGRMTPHESAVETDGEDEWAEWSIGEATPYNNKNAYPFAMAEKRAKDRVILKLVGIHGEVYSEEEADSFKDKPIEPKKVEPKVEKPKKEIPWQECVIHFSRHEGTKLGDLTESQLAWWRSNWDPTIDHKTKEPKTPSKEDLFMKKALEQSIKKSNDKTDGFGN
jgi:hypothetical protein